MKNIELINIAEQFGTPIYVYDSDKIKSQFFRLKNAFKSIHNLRINYAVKASPNISILKFLNNLGAGLDTVSIQEVELGLKAGFNPKKIIFTPNGINIEELEEASKKIFKSILIIYQYLNNLEVNTLTVLFVLELILT